MTVFLIRHPAPLVDAGVCYGQTDLAVSAQQVTVVAHQLAAHLPSPMKLYSSPLQRCVELARRLHTEVILDDRLMEMHFGRWEMQTWEAIGREEIDTWAQNPASYAPGDGESVTQMAHRVIAFLDMLAASKANDNIAQVIVTHAGWIRLALHYAPEKSAAEIAELAARTPQKINFGECIKLHR
jgi:alpha-ribazole phosphatase